MDRVSSFLAMEGIFCQKYLNPEAEIELRTRAIEAAIAQAKTIYTSEMCENYGFHFSLDNWNDDFLALKSMHGFFVSPFPTGGKLEPGFVGFGPGAKHVHYKYTDEVNTVKTMNARKMADWLKSSEFAGKFTIDTTMLCRLREKGA